MKKIVVLVMTVLMCVSIFAGCGGNTEPTVKDNAFEAPTIPTEPPTAVETALQKYMEEHEIRESVWDHLVVYFNDVSVDVSKETKLDDMLRLFEYPLSVTEGQDVSTLERIVPEVVGIEERLSYKRIVDTPSFRAHYWNFFAESSSETHTVRWVEIDPLHNYNGDTTLAVNDVDLSMSLEEVLDAWGKPTYYGVNLREGSEILVFRWEYSSGIKVYACFSAELESGIGASKVLNVYADLTSMS